MKQGTIRAVWRPLCLGAAVLAWLGCTNPTAGSAGEPSPETTGQDGGSTEQGGGSAGQDGGDTGDTAAPAVSADPGDTGDAPLVPASKALEALGLSEPVLIVFSETASPVITASAKAAAGATATVSAEGNQVTVTLTAGGAHIVAQGVSEDASLTFSGNYDVNLYLNGLGLTAPLAAVNDDDDSAENLAAVSHDGGGALNLTLVEGTANRLLDGAGGSQKAALYSKGSLAIGGSGSLEVRGKTAHALAAKTAFTQTGGTIQVKEAVKDGVNAKTVAISGGEFTARTRGDGIQGDEGVALTGGVFSLITTAEEVKAHGVKSDGDLVVGTEGGSGPQLSITVYGSGSKALSADGALTIHGGTLNLATAGNGFWDTDADEEDKTTACAGIKCDGALTINGGSLTILSTGTGGKGISTDGDLTIHGGSLHITTTGAAYVYGAYDTKAKGIKSDQNITINGGSIAIKTYTDGAEGIECEYALAITDGLIEIESYDDGLNASGGEDGASGSIHISGGRVFCTSGGNDGIDSNGTITVSGGLVIALGTTAPEEGFDCDNQPFTVSGGTLLGMGGATSKPSPGEALCTVECNVSASGLYHIEGAEGGEVLSFSVPRTYQGTVCLLFGGGGMERGTDYTLYAGGSVSGGSNFHGLSTGGTYTRGSAVGTFTGAASDVVGTPSSSPGPGASRGSRARRRPEGGRPGSRVRSPIRSPDGHEPLVQPGDTTRIPGDTTRIP